MDIRNLAKAAEIKEGLDSLTKMRMKIISELCEENQTLEDGAMKDINRKIRNGIAELEQKIIAEYTEILIAF